MISIRHRALPAVVCALAGAATADQIVQDGSLQGSEGGPTPHEIVLDQFDTMGGTRSLNFIQFDFLTSTIGGGQTNGSGIPTHVYSRLAADYYHGETLIAETEALIDTMISNTGPPSSFTVFDTDTAKVTYTEPADVDPWIGTGTIVMTGWVEFEVFEDPKGSTGFSAGGSVHYTVTYDYDVVDLVGDLDGDGTVGATDLAILLGAWGPCPVEGECPADLDGDGEVNAADLAILLGNWS